MQNTEEDIRKNWFVFLQNHQYYDQLSKQLEEQQNKVDHNEWLYNTFFSEANMEKIQQGLKGKVYEKSNKRYMIGNQRKEHLIQIMKGIYKDYCQNLPYNLKEQIEELNKKVVEFSYPYAINQIETYIEYQIFSNQSIQPLDLPKNTSITGQRTLPAYPI